MRKHIFLLTIIVLLGSLLVGACWPKARSSNQEGIAQTAAAQTWDVMSAAFTATFTPSLTFTLGPPSSTPTITPTSTSTETPIPSITPIPSSTPTSTSDVTVPSLTPIDNDGDDGDNGGGGTYPTATLKPSATPACDKAGLVAHLTMPTGVDVPPSTRFTKIWRIYNAGYCTWDQNYRFKFFSGETFGAPLEVMLPHAVKPRQTVDIAVPMVAPATDGGYVGNWRLYDLARNVTFGYGDSNNDFKVALYVATKTSGTYFNYVSHYCTASWVNGAGMNLECPSQIGSKFGFPIMVRRGLDYDPITAYRVLWTHPDTSPKSSIIGTYPYVFIPANTKFTAEIGCLAKFFRCDVTFTLNYQVYGQSMREYDSWRETYDNQATRFEIGLESLNNSFVSFQFVVEPNGPISDAAAYWLSTNIEYRSP